MKQGAPVLQVRYVRVESWLPRRGRMQRSTVPQLQVYTLTSKLWSMQLSPRVNQTDPRPADEEAIELLRSECPHMAEEVCPYYHP